MVVRLTVWTLSVLAVLTGACFALTDFEELQTTRRETFELPFNEQGELPQFDILFVVDRPNHHDETMWDAMDDVSLQSGDMPESLGVSWDNNGPGSGQVELHIGVITSDLGAGFTGFDGCDTAGDDGILQSDVLPMDSYGEYGCEPLDDGDPFIRVVDGVVQNMGFIRDVGAAVQCLVLAQMTRTTTCPIKQPIRAVQRALSDHRDTANQLFLRDEGGLAVVFISGEDDCSADDFSLYDDPSLFGPYHCFSQGLDCDQDGNLFTNCAEPVGGVLMPTLELADLLGAAKGENAVVVSVMAGPYDANLGVVINEVPDLGMQIQPSCLASGSPLQALPAIRLSLLQNHFADSAMFQEICAPDSGQFFEGVAHKLAAQTAYRCMPKVPVDTATSVPGMQAQCNIVDVLNPGEVGEERTDPYPECSQSGYGVTCWEMMAESNCTAQYKLVLQRAADDLNESQGYIVEADCLVHMEDPGSI